jgi:excisionase family DNA binding protein
MDQKLNSLISAVNNIQRDMTKRFYTTKEACEYLGCSEYKLRILRIAGDIQYIERRGRYYYRLVDLVEHLERYPFEYL